MKNFDDFFQKKQANIEKSKDPNQSNVDKLNYVKREASRYFRKKKGISESLN